MFYGYDSWFLANHAFRSLLKNYQLFNHFYIQEVSWSDVRLLIKLPNSNASYDLQ